MPLSEHDPSPERDETGLLAYLAEHRDAAPSDLLIWVDEINELAPLAYTDATCREALLLSDDTAGIRLWAHQYGADRPWLYLMLRGPDGTWVPQPMFQPLVPGEPRYAPCTAATPCWACKWLLATGEMHECDGRSDRPITAGVAR